MTDLAPTEPDVAWGAWPDEVRDDPFGHFAAARERCPVQRVRLSDGHDAWVALGYEAARQALNDPRISKDMLAALAANGEVVSGGLPGPEYSRHMLNVDPPDHTRLRRLVARACPPASPGSSPRSAPSPTTSSTSSVPRVPAPWSTLSPATHSRCRSA